MFENKILVLNPSSMEHPLNVLRYLDCRKRKINMGLDSFWELPSGSKKANFNPPLRLCGGIFSGSGEGSFRGKVYDSIVETVTGESLYQEEINPSTVAKMASALQSTEFESIPLSLRSPEGDGFGDGVTAHEYDDLRRMFSSYAELGASLKGWW